MKRLIIGITGASGAVYGMYGLFLAELANGALLRGSRRYRAALDTAFVETRQPA